MRDPDAPPMTRAVVLRAIGFGVAIVLGAIAVWLIVTSTTQKRIEIGVLAGLWGLLLGAYSMFGARRHGLDGEDFPRRSISDVPLMSAADVAVRSSREVERIAEAAARRAFEERLEQMLRRELNREVADLRGEIARLRQDLLEKVGGQLRLERIETTRVIGSDLEALQLEVRQLKHASESGTLHELGLGGTSVRKIVEPASVRPISRPAAEAQADIRPARSSQEQAVQRPAAEQPAAPPPPPAKAPETPVETTGPIRLRAPRSIPEPWAPPPAKQAADEAAVEKAAVEKAAADKAAAEKAAAAKADADRLSAEKKAAAEKAAAEKKAAEKKAAEKKAAEKKAAAEKAAAEKKAAADKAAAEKKAAADKAAAEKKAAADKAAAEKAAADKAAADQRAANGDPFASLPRITPFTEFELDPVETSNGSLSNETAAGGSADDTADAVATDGAPANGAHSAVSPYTGRRRRAHEADDEGDDVDDSGRHSRHESEAAGGRRRRADDESEDDGVDLLSRLLARGSSER